MKFRQFAKQLEKEPPKKLAKLSLLFFLVSLLIGFSTGLFFRELRLNRLSERQKVQALEEDNAIRSAFEKYTQKVR